MEPDEIRAEIERRKKRARDLNLRETLWDLYYRRFSRYPKLLEEDPPIVYPEVKETFSLSVLPSTQLFPKGILVQFRMGPKAYQILYKEAPGQHREQWGSSRGLPEETITPATLALTVDGEQVLNFKVRRSVRDEEWGPVFSDGIGEITTFIDGAWTVELTELLQKIKLHEKAIWEQRQVPKLKEQMKQFGL
jgi:hypothetical protein